MNDDQLSGIEVPMKLASKSSKNEGKILPPIAPGDKKKRFRRTANEIERHYKWPAETCKKCYGSEGSLNQHVKLKHPELAYSTSADKKSALALAIARGAQMEQEALNQAKKSQGDSKSPEDEGLN